MSAGAPVLSPVQRAIVFAPICAHILSVCPIVLGGDETIRIRIRSPHAQLALTIDGQDSFGLRPDDTIEVKRAREEAFLVVNPEKSFYSILSAKMGWGRR